jgi:hypothetical protein
LRRESGSELQADTRKPENNQSGVSQKNADGERGLKDGKVSRELDLIDYINEQADEEELTRAHSRADESMMNRLHLINALESITEYPSERGSLSDYRAMAETIAGSEN